MGALKVVAWFQGIPLAPSPEVPFGVSEVGRIEPCVSFKMKMVLGEQKVLILVLITHMEQ